MTAQVPALPTHNQARTVSRSIWYKSVEYPSVHGETFSLENAIRIGLELAPNWQQRVQEIHKDDGELLVLNEHKLIDAGGVCGRLMLFSRTAGVEVDVTPIAVPAVMLVQ